MVEQSDFQMTAEKKTTYRLLLPITIGANNATMKSEFLAISCNLLKGREKSRVQGVTCFGFAEKLARDS